MVTAAVLVLSGCCKSPPEDLRDAYRKALNGAKDCFSKENIVRDEADKVSQQRAETRRDMGMDRAKRADALALLRAQENLLIIQVDEYHDLGEKYVRRAEDLKLKLGEVEVAEAKTKQLQQFDEWDQLVDEIENYLLQLAERSVGTAAERVRNLVAKVKVLKK